MDNCNNEKIVSHKINKANDYHLYLMITKLYPEIKQLSEQEILSQICELFENSIATIKNDCGRICYQYVVYGLIPTYEKHGDKCVLNKCLEHLKIAESSNYDDDLLRDICITKAKVYMLLSQFECAEKYILIAYNDYDYRTSTFSLLMKILDLQNKFQSMIHYLKQYCIEFSKLHEKIQIDDLDIKNIKTSDYIDQFNTILEGDYAVEF